MNSVSARPGSVNMSARPGTLEAGIPMLILQPELKSTIGWLYWNKIVILFLFVLWSIVSSRPFCRTTCPLGAFYALFNRHRLIRLKHVARKLYTMRSLPSCVPHGHPLQRNAVQPECISCMQCMTKACNYGAISFEVAGYSLLDNVLPANEKNCLIHHETL
jgi:ferredoxin-type protein NapH